MTVFVAQPLPRPNWTHRAAVRVGRALLAWGARPGVPARGAAFADRVRSFEQARDGAARTLPQLPR